MSLTGHGPIQGRDRGDQVQPQMSVTNQDLQGGVQDSSQDLRGLLAEFTRMANTIQAG